MVHRSGRDVLDSRGRCQSGSWPLARLPARCEIKLSVPHTDNDWLGWPVTTTRLAVIRLILCVYLVGGQSEKEPDRSADPAERRTKEGIRLTINNKNNSCEHAADSNFESVRQPEKEDSYIKRWVALPSDLLFLSTSPRHLSFSLHF